MTKTVYDYKKIKKQILAEAELHKKFGSIKLVSFCKNEIFNNDIQGLYDFLTSKFGGFEAVEVYQILNKINLDKKQYQKKVMSGLQPF